MPKKGTQSKKPTEFDRRLGRRIADARVDGLAGAMSTATPVQQREIILDVIEEVRQTGPVTVEVRWAEWVRPFLGVSY